MTVEKICYETIIVMGGDKSSKSVTMARTLSIKPNVSLQIINIVSLVV